MQGIQHIEPNLLIGSSSVQDDKQLNDQKLSDFLLSGSACSEGLEEGSCSSDEESWCDHLIGLIIEIPDNFDHEETTNDLTTSRGNDVPLCMSASWKGVRRRSMAKSDATPRRDGQAGSRSLRASTSSSSTAVCLGESWNTRFAAATRSGKSDRSMKLPIKSADTKETTSFSPNPVSRVSSFNSRQACVFPTLLPFGKRK